MSNIIVLTEHRDGEFEEVSFELLGEARRITRSKNGNVMAVVLGDGVNNMANELARHGAHTVFVADDARLAHYDPDVWLETIGALCQQEAPDLILLHWGRPGCSPGCEKKLASVLTKHEI